MPVATPDQYAQMLDAAKAGGFAYPAFNVSSSQTVNSALQGLSEVGSDGILQISTGGADYFAGQSVKARASGALAFAAFATEVAKNYPIKVALHTDHCPANALDGFVMPLIEASEAEVKAGRNPIFQSHMWDGSAVPLAENVRIAAELLPRMKAIHSILEVEIGVVGGEEDGISNELNEKLYTSPKDMERVAEVLGPPGERGRYLLAAVFGNVHGVYKPGAVKLKPSILREGQEHVGAKLGKKNPFDLVFHGGSGSAIEEIHETLGYGVVKMNIDTDTQYAFTRPVVDHMFTNYSGVLKVDGDVGNKKVYDPRSYGKAAEAGMAARVVEGCVDLKSTGEKMR
jgi:fructose-bisphosphate aldolase, class II